MSTALDQEFETGVRLIRDAYSKKLSQKESEVVNLRGENARKDAEIKEMQMRISNLESQLNRSEQRLGDMSRIVSRLSHFKQSVLDSFEEEDYGEVKRKILEKSSRAHSPSTNNNIGGVGGAGGNIVDDFIPYSSFQHSMAQGGVGAGDYSSILRDSVTGTRVAPVSVATNEKTEKVSSFLTSSNSHQQTGNTSTSNDKQSNATAENTVDGREYFKRAKSVLTYDEFTNLLWNVKSYNNRQQSRLKTLENVYATIGTKNPQLYDEFERLLSR